MALTVKTNNVPREILEWFDLTDEELSYFDYYDESEIDAGNILPQFFRYKGEVYDLGEFEALDTNRYGLLRENPELSYWHGIKTDSFFSGILVRYSQDNETVIVGSCYT